MRFLTVTRLVDVFSIHTSVEQAVDSAARALRVTAPVL
jgi:hypothetical protein